MTFKTLAALAFVSIGTAYADVDYTVATYQCDTEYCSAYTYGEQINGYWYGDLNGSIYGQCNTNYDFVSADNGIAWIYCSSPKAGTISGWVDYVTQYEDGYLVDLGFVEETGYIYENTTVIYETHKRQYCDGSDPVLIHSPNEPC